MTVFPSFKHKQKKELKEVRDTSTAVLKADYYILVTWRQQILLFTNMTDHARFVWQTERSWRTKVDLTTKGENLNCSVTFWPWNLVKQL